ncbi:MAG: quinone oxidoreductase family protein [Gammaproteobacteria bacterium]
MRIRQTGEADKLRAETITLPPLAAGEALVKVAAAGVNFIDVYHRTGLYPLPLPAVLGLEGAGVVEEVAADVVAVKPGDRVGFCAAGLGAYAGYKIAPAERLTPLPDDISFEQAAAVLLKGMTVEYLIRRLYPVRAGQVVLWHAAAGGVGLLACQWLKQLGATVIGTAGSEEKAQLAKAHGCDYVVLYGEEDVAKRVREITDGKGVPVAFDSVGASTFQSTLDSLAVRGMFVSFGNASGAVPPFEPGVLAAKGSLFFTRPTLMSYCASAAEIRESADALFFAVRGGLRINIGKTLPLADAALAHELLESRQTTAATILLP